MTVTTRITTPFGRDTTAQDVLHGVDLTGKRAVVTGGAAGVGAEVTLAVRNIEAGESVAAPIVAGTGNAGVAAASGQGRTDCSSPLSTHCRANG